MGYCLDTLVICVCNLCYRCGGTDFPTQDEEAKPSFVNVVLQVEQQFSHKFTVTVVRAESVTKGALGDLCESKYILFFVPIHVTLT